MRYLIVKAQGGLGNSLCATGRAIVHAKQYNRVLLIDWTCSLEINQDFFQFFGLNEEIPHESQTLKVLRELNADTNITLYPPFFQGNLISKENWDYNLILQRYTWRKAKTNMKELF